MKSLNNFRNTLIKNDKITKDKFIEQSQKYDLNLDQEFFNYCSYKENIIDTNLFFELVDSINMKP